MAEVEAAADGRAPHSPPPLVVSGVLGGDGGARCGRLPGGSAPEACTEPGGTLESLESSAVAAVGPVAGVVMLRDQT